MSPFQRRFATFSLVALFSLMLAGTSKGPPPSGKGSSAPTNVFTGSAAPSSQGGVPSADEWATFVAPAAKLKLKLPPGTQLVPNGNGIDPAFAGAYVRFKFPSGYEAYFAERSTNDAVDIAQETRSYEEPGRSATTFLVRAGDAVVVRRKEGPPFGTYCEVTACGTLKGKPICALAEGALDEFGKITKMAESECLAMVAIARSIEAAP